MTWSERAMAALRATFWAAAWGLLFGGCAVFALATVVMSAMLEGGIMPMGLFWGVCLLVGGLVLYGWHTRVVAHLSEVTALRGRGRHAVAAGALAGYALTAWAVRAGQVPAWVLPLAAFALAFAGTFAGPRDVPRPPDETTTTPS